MPDDPTPEPTLLGRAGRRRQGARGEPSPPRGELSPPLGAVTPPLAAAGFLALLRSRKLAGAESAELLAGRLGHLRTLAGPEAEALLALHAAIAAALEAGRGTVGRVGEESTARAALLGRAPVAGPAAVVHVRPLLRLGPHDLLRPELAMIGAPDGPGGGAPSDLGAAGFGPARALLVVELAPPPTTRRGGAAPDETGARLGAYARAGVREVWLLDLARGWTEAYRAPWAGLFGSRTLWYPGEEVPLAALPGLAVAALALA